MPILDLRHDNWKTAARRTAAVGLGLAAMGLVVATIRWSTPVANAVLMAMILAAAAIGRRRHRSGREWGLTTGAALLVAASASVRIVNRYGHWIGLSLLLGTHVVVQSLSRWPRGMSPLSSLGRSNRRPPKVLQTQPPPCVSSRQLRTPERRLAPQPTMQRRRHPTHSDQRIPERSWPPPTVSGITVTVPRPWTSMTPS